MKKTLIALCFIALCLTPFIVRAWMNPYVAGGGCNVSTCGTGGLFSETFENTGYDNTWTETVPANCTIDEDSEVLTPLPCSDSMSVFLENIGAGSSDANTINATPNNEASLYTRFYINVSSCDVGVGDYGELVVFVSTVGSRNITFEIREASGPSYSMYLKYYDRDVSANAADAIISSFSLDTTYRVEAYFSETNSIHEVKVDGVYVVEAGNTPDTDIIDLKISTDTHGEMSFYVTRIDISTTGWIGE